MAEEDIPMSKNEDAVGDTRQGGATTAETVTSAAGTAARTRIAHHAYLGLHPPHDEAVGYLDSLLTVAARNPSTDDHGLAYLRTLASSFDVVGFDAHRSSQDTTGSTADTAELLRRLGTGWSWLADATFVLCLDGQTDAPARQGICSIVCEAGLPPDAVAEFATLMADLATESGEARVLAKVCALSKHDSNAWKAIVDFRGLSFHEAVRPLRSSLGSLGSIREAVNLSLDMTAERWKVLDCMSGIPDEGLAVRIAVAANRRVRVSKFGTFKQKVADFVARDRVALDEAQRIARAFGLQDKAPVELGREAVADRDVGYGNQSWNDKMDRAYDVLQATLDTHSQAMTDASDHIARIADGRW